MDRLTIRGPKTGLTFTATIFALVNLIAACGSEDPSFKEETYQVGNEALSEEALEEARRSASEADAQAVRRSGTSDDDDLDEGEDGEDGSDGDLTGEPDGDADGEGGEELLGEDGGIDGGADGGADSGADGGMADAGGADGGVDGGADGGLADGGADGGITLVYREQTVTQQGPGKVDILWVIDSSGSMSEEQTYLGNNFNSFITALNDAGHDFQTAVTSTDVCRDAMPPTLAERRCPAGYGGNAATRLRGSFVGNTGQQVLAHGQADLVSKFNDYTSVGTSGSGFEHGLKAADLAIDKVMAGDNDALIRNDAFLAVIVVSDEEDDGIGLSKLDYYTNKNFWEEGLTEFKFTEDDMISRLQTVKGAGNFSISAIAPTRNADGSLCSAPHSAPKEEGTQYIKAAEKTGGIIQSICETDWSTSLQNIGLDLDAQITQVALEGTADAATIKVYVNNVETTEFTYNAGNNAVKFNPGHVPIEGDVIKVTYYAMN